MHLPVLAGEVLSLLSIQPDGIYLDVTAGGGGHAEEILKRLSPSGRLLLSDCDEEAVRRLKTKFGSEKRCRIYRTRFSEIFGMVKEEGWLPVSGLLADLGLSTDELDDPERGFSFLKDGPLDMRMDPRLEETAADFLARLSERDLIRLLTDYGEERHARKLARALVEQRRERPFTRTGELAQLAQKVLGFYYRREKIHPATRLFQALRIAVNRELDELQFLLAELPDLLGEGGRAAFISFHSLEDRLVKQAFRSYKEKGWFLITRKPVVPGRDEVVKNPRSRSAKLRVIEKR